MTIFEAIKHCQDRARKCDECGAEHRQLQEWMEELLQYREIGTIEEFKKLTEKHEGRSDWIPTDERTPEESMYYLVTVEACGFPYVRTEWFSSHKDYGVSESEWRELIDEEKVTAWMPLPEPYCQEGSE